MSKRKILLKCTLSPGDVLMLTAAVREIQTQFPGKFAIAVETSAGEIWEHNPHIIKVKDKERLKQFEVIDANYPLIHRCNDAPYHFIHGYCQDLEDKLGIRLRPRYFWGDVHLSTSEKRWLSQFFEERGYDAPYWVINAGSKRDYTCKQWHYDRYQAIIDHFRDSIEFVQVGSADHVHPKLHGPNLLNLVGKTDMRQLIRLLYHSAGVITGVSLPMHLARAVPVKPHFKRDHRPCVVLAGSREPAQWEMYGEHAYFSNCGTLTCSHGYGGCWKSRIMKLNDGSKQDASLCEKPIDVETEFDTEFTFKRDGSDQKWQRIPKCMDMIPVDHVIKAIEDYLEDYDYYRFLQYDDNGVLINSNS
jgi:ADP-heptose:LPS heptosyltransferase